MMSGDRRQQPAARVDYFNLTGVGRRYPAAVDRAWFESVVRTKKTSDGNPSPVLENSYFVENSRGGTRTRDPGIMSAVL
jgi:hypothetical protein